MAVQYNKLFHILVDKKMTNSQLAEKAGISMNIITRLRQDKYVSMESIEKICFALDCKVDDVLEFNRNEG
ncbi:MAG: helix-turn-helix transcriptional regulator [Catenibacterium sp.]|uniref:helix-turn-helix domain-containing protein n=1 Tax=Catenibacterium sp. TaxID=2049022 RepID=UPI001EC0C641|nr:helix-turn-helix transcriptional regulator [Catenibacterium sp.]MBS5592042.1 helix-turn-helix transcriptional regulator [Catenibacterium sp.]